MTDFDLAALTASMIQANGPDIVKAIRQQEREERDRVWQAARDSLPLMVTDIREHHAHVHGDEGERCDDFTCPGPDFLSWADKAEKTEILIVLTAALFALSDHLPEDLSVECAAALARDEQREQNEDPATTRIRMLGGDGAAAFVVGVRPSSTED